MCGKFVGLCREFVGLCRRHPVRKACKSLILWGLHGLGGPVHRKRGGKLKKIFSIRRSLTRLASGDGAMRTQRGLVDILPFWAISLCAGDMRSWRRTISCRCMDFLVTSAGRAILAFFWLEWGSGFHQRMNRSRGAFALSCNLFRFNLHTSLDARGIVQNRRTRCNHFAWTREISSVWKACTSAYVGMFSHSRSSSPLKPSYGLNGAPGISSLDTCKMLRTAAVKRAISGVVGGAFMAQS